VSLNKTEIEWCDYTWNPVTGCNHGCTYCYARAISKRFKRSFAPEFHEDRLKDPRLQPRPSTIFAISMGDLFGEWVPAQWILNVLLEVDKNKHHTFCFLTKNPQRMIAWGSSHRNAFFGTSVTGIGDLQRIEDLKDVKTDNRFISFEPLLGTLTEPLDLDGISGVLIGAQTNPTIRVPAESIKRIIDACNESAVKIFFKDTLLKQNRDYPFYRELPWGVRK
jgi:protein gp37